MTSECYPELIIQPRRGIVFRVTTGIHPHISYCVSINTEEKAMLTVTNAAVKVLKKHVSQWHINSPIRIALMDGCCTGDTLRFTLCTPGKYDRIFIFDSIIFVIDRDLAAQCGRIKIDFDELYDRCPCTGHNGGLSIKSELLSPSCSCPSCSETDIAICRKEKDSMSPD